MVEKIDEPVVRRTPERRLAQVKANMKTYRERLAKKRRAEAEELAGLRALFSVEDVSK